MATNNSVKIKITGDSSDLKKELSSLGKDVQNFGTSASAIFKGIMASQIVTKGFSMLSSGLKSAINTGMNFEAQMSRVQAIAGATNEELDTLTAKAKELGQTSVFTAQEAAEGMENLASAGFEVQEIMDAMPGMLNLAASSGEDLASSAETTASILRAFGLDASEAGHVADVLATNAAKTNAAVADTGEAMKYVAPMANTMGLSMEECAAAIGILSDSGIKGSQAGTTLRSALSRLAKPTSAMQSVMKELGLEFYDSEGKMKSLSELVAMLQSSLSGLTQEEQQNALVTLFGQEAMSGMMVLMNSGSEKLSSLTQSYQECTGSAEEMANTMIDNLSGDVKLLESAFEALQITASESTNGMARSVVQMGTDLLTALNEAGKTGGLSGIADAFIEQIPELLPKITKGIESVLGSLGKKLPVLAKNLIAQIPSILTSSSSLIPSLTSSLFSAASGAVEGLVAMLPELVPVLFEGIANMVVSVVTGLGDVLDGLGKGIRTALLSLGLVEPTAEEAWESLVKTVDNTKALEIAGEVDANYTVDTEITVGDIKTKVETAQSEIEEQLKDVEGIDASTIAEKIIAGNSADVLGDVLKSIGIDTDKVDSVVGTIEGAQSSIQTAIDGLGLTEDQETTIQQMIESGATSNDISEYLMKTCGVDSAEADKVVETITTAQTNISDAIKSLDMETVISENLTTMVEEGATTNEIVEYLKQFNVDTQTATDIAESITTGGASVSSAISDLGLGMTAATWLTRIAASGDKSLLAGALQMMGLDDADISGVLASYDTVKGTITAGIASIFTDIEDTLTDGKADTPEEMSALEQQVRAWADESYAKIQEWYDDEVAKLAEAEKSGEVSKEDADAQLASLTASYNELTASVTETADSTVAFITDCAGKSTTYCAERMTELSALKDQAYDLAAQIDALSLDSQQQQQYEASRTLTINGRTNDQKTQLEAIKLTAAEYESAVAAADQEYANTVAALQEQVHQGTLSEEDYAKQEAEAAQKLAEAYQSAGDEYNQMMNLVLAGIAKANPEFAQTIQGLQSLKDTTDKVDQIKSAIGRGQSGETNSDGSPITAESIMKDLGITDVDGFAAQLGERLGMELSGEQLLANIRAGLGGATTEDNVFMEWGSMLSQDLEDGFAEAISNLGGDESSMAATVSAAMENGWITGVNDIDWSDLSTQAEQIINTAMEGVTVTLTVVPEVETPEEPNAGETVGEQITESVSDAADNVDIDLSGVAEKAEEEVGNVTDAMDAGDTSTSNGNNVALGFCNAIINTLDDKYSAISNKVAGIVALFAKVPEVKSPSRVTMKYGHFVGEGFEIGMSESLNHAEKTVRSIVGSIVDATNVNVRPSLSASDLVGSLNGAMADFADIETNRDIAMYVNGREFARATTKDYNSALNGYAKRIGLGYGRG